MAAGSDVFRLLFHWLVFYSTGQTFSTDENTHIYSDNNSPQIYHLICVLVILSTSVFCQLTVDLFVIYSSAKIISYYYFTNIFRKKAGKSFYVFSKTWMDYRILVFEVKPPPTSLWPL